MILYQPHGIMKLLLFEILVETANVYQITFLEDVLSITNIL